MFFLQFGLFAQTPFMSSQVKNPFFQYKSNTYQRTDSNNQLVSITLYKTPMITTTWPQKSYFHRNPKFQRKVNSVTEAEDLLRYKHPACYLMSYSMYFCQYVKITTRLRKIFRSQVYLTIFTGIFLKFIKLYRQLPA